jgi:hypothetical protein
MRLSVFGNSHTINYADLDNNSLARHDWALVAFQDKKLLTLEKMVFL